MAKLEELQRGWQRIAENKIRCAQLEGEFDDLPGLGRPLEEFMDIDDPYGWAKRTVKESLSRQASSIPAIGVAPLPRTPDKT